MTIEALKMRRNLPGTKAEFATSIPAPLELVEPIVREQDGVAQAAQRAREALDGLNRAWAQLSPDEQEHAHRALIREEARCSAELASQMPLAMDHAPLSEQLAYAEEGAPSRDECAARIREDADNIERALDYASWRVDDLALSGRLLQEVHGIALDSARYDKATPGWFRTSPVWMGNPGAGLGEASFVAPNVEDMAEAWRALEQHMNGEAGGAEGLVSIALEHYQFETIHPFLDGNGRVGRVAAVQSLVERGLSAVPVLPLSWALEQDSFGYFAGFLAVQQRGDYRSWVLMLIHALECAAQHAHEQLAQA